MTNLASNAVNKFGRKLSGKGAVRAEKDLIHSFRMKI